ADPHAHASPTLRSPFFRTRAGSTVVARIARKDGMYRWLALLVSMLPAFALAAPGGLDFAFGDGGNAVASDVSVDYVGGLAAQPAGRLVAAASRAGFADTGVLYLVGY